MKSGHFILAGYTALLVSCATEAPPPPNAPQRHPSWSLSPAAKRKLAQNASKLHVGDTYGTVVAALGKPTYDQPMARKESNRIVGRSLKYYAVRWEAGLVSELYDELVSIWLDTHNVVRDISIRVTLSE